jgi:YVTN family beta-propeller protein
LRFRGVFANSSQARARPCNKIVCEQSDNPDARVVGRAAEQKDVATPRILALCLIPVAAAPRLSARLCGNGTAATTRPTIDVIVTDGTDRKLIAAIPAGKRPRGIHASPDGKFLYVALSGTPNMGPPKLDEKGNPVFPEEDPKVGDRTADGIGVIDLKAKKFLKKISTGSDPEQFALGKDGKRLYVANEDVGTATVLNLEDGKVEAVVKVKKEPEGVGVSPDGKFAYVTCETKGEVFVIDTATNKTVAEIEVGGRPRSVAFSPDGTRAFVPSETAGKVTEIDTTTYKVLRAVALPEGSRPMGTVMSADGSRLFVSNGRAGTVCVLDPRGGKVLHTIPVGKRPWGLALSPDGKLLYVANGPSGDVSVVDVREAKELGRVKAGRSPWGVAVVPVRD